MSTDNRPLSPHLQIYRWQWTMAYSILNRATGVALAAGALFLVWWLVALASGAADFDTVHMVAGSWIGRLALFGWTWALFFHMANGIRHLIWDTGAWLELKPAEMSGHAVVVFSIAMTVLAWACAYKLGA